MLNVRFDPFPVLETDRLTLHALTQENAGDMFLLRSNVAAMKFIGKPLLTSLYDAERLIDVYMFNLQEKMGITWGITLKSESNGLVGTIGFHKLDKPNFRAEIGYLLHPDQWNKGIMNEAIKSVLNYGFLEMGLHSVEGRIHPENIPSSRILIKNGFLKEAYFKEAFYSEGKFLDTEVYSLLTPFT